MQQPIHVRLTVRTALALQHLAHVRLAVRASNYIDAPPVNPTYCQNRDIDLPTSTDLSYPRRSSSCIQQLDRPQLPATIVQLHFNDSTDTSYPQWSSRCIQRLDRLQLPATIILLHPTTRSTSATSNDRLAAFLRLDHISSFLPSFNNFLLPSQTKKKPHEFNRVEKNK